MSFRRSVGWGVILASASAFLMPFSPPCRLCFVASKSCSRKQDPLSIQGCGRCDNIFNRSAVRDSSPHIATMGSQRCTVDRLDKPSAYFNSRVRSATAVPFSLHSGALGKGH